MTTSYGPGAVRTQMQPSAFTTLGAEHPRFSRSKRPRLRVPLALSPRPRQLDRVLRPRPSPPPAMTRTSWVGVNQHGRWPIIRKVRVLRPEAASVFPLVEGRCCPLCGRNRGGQPEVEAVAVATTSRKLAREAARKLAVHGHRRP
jgi:hypothetical protein